MEVEKSLKTFGGRLYTLFKDKGYDLEPQNSHAIRDIKKKMIKKGIIPETYDIRARIQQDVKIKENHPDIYTSAITIYCDFLKCSADYLLGFMEKDVADMEKRSGLSEKAIRKLKTNKDYLLVTNTLLEKNGIDFIVQALQAYTYYLHANTYISGQLKAEKIFGITQSDLDMFNANLKSGNNSLKEDYAIVCFDNILKEPNLVDHFLNQAQDRFSNQLDKDIKEKGSK